MIGCFDAGLLGFDAVRVPLERRVAGAAGDQDRDLRQARRQRRAVAQQRAERLPVVGELGVVQRGAQRTLDLAAPAGDDLVVDARCSASMVSGAGREMRGIGVSWSIDELSRAAARRTYPAARISAMPRRSGQDGSAATCRRAHVVDDADDLRRHRRHRAGRALGLENAIDTVRCNGGSTMRAACSRPSAPRSRPRAAAARCRAVPGDQRLLQRQRVGLDHRRQRDVLLARHRVERGAQPVRRARQDEGQFVQRGEGDLGRRGQRGRRRRRSGSCRRWPATAPARAARGRSGTGWRCRRAHRPAIPRPGRSSLRGSSG